MPNLLNNLLRRLREHTLKGVAPDAVGQKAGFGPNQLTKYENGQLRKPPAESAVRLFEAFGCGPMLQTALLHLIELGGDVTGPSDGQDGLRPLDALVAALWEETKRRARATDGPAKIAVRSIRSVSLPTSRQSGPVSYVVLPPAFLSGSMLEPAAAVAALGDVRLPTPASLRALPWRDVDVTCFGRVLVYWHTDAAVMRVSADQGDINAFHTAYELFAEARARPVDVMDLIDASIDGLKRVGREVAGHDGLSPAGYESVAPDAAGAEDPMPVHPRAVRDPDAPPSPVPPPAVSAQPPVVPPKKPPKRGKR